MILATDTAPKTNTLVGGTKGESRPSLWAVAAGIVSIAVLFYVNGGGILLPFLALGLIGPYFFSQRLESNSYLRWMVRVALIALIYQLVQVQDNDGRNVSLAIGSTGLRGLFGHLYAAEMVVQAWRRRPDGAFQSTLGITLFSGMVFLTACNTFDDRIGVLATPVYMFLVAFALRDWRRRQVQERGVAADTPPIKKRNTLPSTALRLGVVFFALGLGFASERVVGAFKDNINELGTRLISEQHFFESMGMGSQPELGSMFGLRGSPTRVLRVKGLSGDAHLRGATFDFYMNGRWGPPLPRRQFDMASSEALSPVRPVFGTVVSRSREDVTITRLTNMPLLFAPVNSVGLTTGDSTDNSDRVDWAPDSGGIMRTRARAPFDYIVSVASDVPYQGPLCQPILTNKTARDRYLQVPPVEEPGRQPNKDALYMRNLALKITANSDTTPKKIAAVTQYLLSHHHYSLSVRIGAGDPVASFLRDRKDAHCEFFAASSTLLLRYAGVPARYVTGYLAHEQGREPGEIIVRQRDAHAWTEAWVDGVGWIPVDATPGDGRPDEMVMEKISSMQKFNEWFQDKIQQAKDKLADLPPAILNTIVVLMALLPLGIYALVNVFKVRRNREKNKGTVFTYAEADAAIAELVKRFEAAFARIGRPFAPEKTYSEQLTAPTPENLVTTGRQFARAYDAARFGGRRDSETLATLNRLVEQIERETALEKKQK